MNHIEETNEHFIKSSKKNLLSKKNKVSQHTIHNNNNSHYDQELINHGLQKLVAHIPKKRTVKPLSKFSNNTLKEIDEINANRSDELIQVPSRSPVLDENTMTEQVDEDLEIVGEQLNLKELNMRKKSYRDCDDVDPRLRIKYGIMEDINTTHTNLLTELDRGEPNDELLIKQLNCEEEEYKEEVTKKDIIIKASTTAIAKICAICLIAVLMWNFLDNELIELFSLEEEPESLVKSNAKYVGGAIVNICDIFFNNIARLLSMRTSDFFGTERQQSATWFGSLMELL